MYGPLRGPPEAVGPMKNSWVSPPVNGPGLDMSQYVVFQYIETYQYVVFYYIETYQYIESFFISATDCNCKRKNKKKKMRQNNKNKKQSDNNNTNAKQQHIHPRRILIFEGGKNSILL